MSITNPTPLSQRLLCLLKSETSSHDCIVLKCRDAKERKAHRTVLIASSSHFSDLLRDDPALETVDVPYTSEVVDIVIDYMYSSETINFQKKQAVQLFSAANYFSLEHLSQQIETFFRFSMDEATQDEEFLKDDTVEDVKRMKPVFEEVRCDKLRLVSRILGWEKSKKAAPDFIIELLNSAVGSISDGTSSGEVAPQGAVAESSKTEQADTAAATATFKFSTPTVTKGGESVRSFNFGTATPAITPFGAATPAITPFGAATPSASLFGASPSSFGAFGSKH